jgi:hypothetical protein
VKKIALLALLIPLTLFEFYVCTAFLPDQWQRTINDHIPDIFPQSNDWTPITHPLLSQEIEQVLHEHIGLRIALYTITVALLIGNGLLIRWVWRLARRRQAASDLRAHLT